MASLYQDGFKEVLCTVTMGSTGGLALLKPLLILAVLCHSGYGLKCYSCIAVGTPCSTVTNCTFPLDSCLFVKAASRLYYHCWKMADCNFQYISTTLEESKLQYSCCQKDLCNSHPGTAFPGKIVLLMTTLLVAAWNLCL
ncbi:PREDICTED: CD59 glycoprotein [Chrysochloris asiatica]|uniref:MAC-inhibitory protein n=1 Tax=Chrysochloris asiatica TaxID=185453 RepID=A0A9B0TIE3_CHRAS|nr:PREDICTED: CD59 glycoprotein [Chrysochloris asiatica]